MAIAFRGFLPRALWEAVSEMATFFRDICASSLDVARMKQWQANIASTLCKLEIFFPPSFFDSMEHLPVHVADQVLLGGPVQYRWMYPFERFIFRLKKLAKNKSKPEASIVQAYLQQEITFLGSDYLGPEFKTNANRAKRNELMPGQESISIYNYRGKGGAVSRKRNLTEQEYSYATYYILSNTPELDDYKRLFELSIGVHASGMCPNQRLELAVTHFPTWLQQQVMQDYPNHAAPPWLQDVVMGFHSRVSCYMTYKVNNYKFTTETYSEHRPTVNCQVHVQSGTDTHFYGVIEEILHVRVRRNRKLGIVLFKCRWFDPTHVRTYPSNGIIEVNTQRVYKNYDPFILAQQADQVYYTYFPGLPKKSERGWAAVCKMKPTNRIDLKIGDIPFQDDSITDSALPTVDITSSHQPLADDEEVNEYDIVPNEEDGDDIAGEEDKEDTDAEWTSEEDLTDDSE